MFIGREGNPKNGLVLFGIIEEIKGRVEIYYLTMLMGSFD